MNETGGSIIEVMASRVEHVHNAVGGYQVTGVDLVSRSLNVKIAVAFR